MGRYIELSEVQAPDPRVLCSGDWIAANARALELELDELGPKMPKTGAIDIDIGGIGALDTTGAWLLTQLRRQATAGEGAYVGAASKHEKLLERINEYHPAELPAQAHENLLLAPFIALGRMVFGTGRYIITLNAMLGHILIALARTVTLQAPLRQASFVQQFDQIILRAIPIVALISLVVGAIVTQQTILQLRNFGASILVVNLAAILMFREIGVLLAAIMVAGRSGSAITAEIGSMRIREEFDALRVMGVDPYQALVLPRTLALVIGLPLLAFVGSMAGLAGAILVARVYGGIPADVFILRLRDAMTITSVAVGLIKGPFMGLLIALIAAVEGMKVQGSAQSLGRRTTSSVVKAIFLVIVADGLFAIFFAAIGF